MRVILILALLLPSMGYAITIGGGSIKKKESKTLQKVPRALFLVKRPKLEAEVAEPVIYPFERQMRILDDRRLGSWRSDE